MIRLTALRREDMPKLLEWRNATPWAWRDPRPTTITQQYEWFDGPVSHSQNGRYWGIEVDCEDPSPCWHFAGQAEITSIDWQSRIGEIGLIINPALCKKGYGRAAVNAVLDRAFYELRLKTVWGECYDVPNGAFNFWYKICDQFKVTLPNRKFWQGSFYDSLYFSWDKDEWAKNK